MHVHGDVPVAVRDRDLQTDPEDTRARQIQTGELTKNVNQTLLQGKSSRHREATHEQFSNPQPAVPKKTSESTCKTFTSRQARKLGYKRRGSDRRSAVGTENARCDLISGKRTC